MSLPCLMKNCHNLVIILLIAIVYARQYRPAPFRAYRGNKVTGGTAVTAEGGKMKKSVDIFWFGESGPVWVEAVRTMERAKACVDALPLKAAGGYVVVDQRTGNSMSFEPNLMDGRRSVWRT